MTVEIDLNMWRNIRAWNELIQYTLLLIVVLITFIRLWSMQKVRFLRTLLAIMALNCFEGMWSGIYWSSYFPGPFLNSDPGTLDPWLMADVFCDFLYTVASHLVIWMVSFKFYNSASQLRVIERFYEDDEKKNKEKQKPLIET